MSGGGETKSPESKAPTTLDAEEGPVGLIHPGDRHRLWISKDTQHFCDMENHDHAHESKLPAEALRLVLEAPHAVLPLARCAS